MKGRRGLERRQVYDGGNFFDRARSRTRFRMGATHVCSSCKPPSTKTPSLKTADETANEEQTCFRFPFVHNRQGYSIASRRSCADVRACFLDRPVLSLLGHLLSQSFYRRISNTAVFIMSYVKTLPSPPPPPFPPTSRPRCRSRLWYSTSPLRLPLSAGQATGPRWTS